KLPATWGSVTLRCARTTQTRLRSVTVLGLGCPRSRSRGRVLGDREASEMSISTAPMAGPAERRLVPSGADPLPGHLDGWLAARGPELVAVRRHLHAHPEPSHQEFETAALVAR